MTFPKYTQTTFPFLSDYPPQPDEDSVQDTNTSYEQQTQESE